MASSNAGQSAKEPNIESQPDCAVLLPLAERFNSATSRSSTDNLSSTVGDMITYLSVRLSNPIDLSILLYRLYRTRRSSRGARMVEVLKQTQYEPMPAEKQVISIYAGFNGFLDDQPLNAIRRFEIDLHEFMTDRYPDVAENIRTTGVLSDATSATLNKAITEFKSQFAA